MKTIGVCVFLPLTPSSFTSENWQSLASSAGASASRFHVRSGNCWGAAIFHDSGDAEVFGGLFEERIPHSFAAITPLPGGFLWIRMYLRFCGALGPVLMSVQLFTMGVRINILKLRALICRGVAIEELEQGIKRHVEQERELEPWRRKQRLRKL